MVAVEVAAAAKKRKPAICRLYASKMVPYIRNLLLFFFCFQTNWLRNRLYIELMKASEQQNERMNGHTCKMEKARKTQTNCFSLSWHLDSNQKQKPFNIEYNWMKWILRVKHFIARVMSEAFVSILVSLVSGLSKRLRILAIWNRFGVTCVWVFFLLLVIAW